jgi:hypothetical protein
MKCPSEFILSQYADGELSEAETNELTTHLEACRACRELAADLKAENRLLVESLQGIDLCELVREAEKQEQSGLMSKSRMAAIALGVILLLRLGLSLIENVEIPPMLQGLNPLSWSGLLNWFVNGIFYISEGGGAVMTSFFKGTGLAILAFLILGCSIVVTRRAMRTKAILGLISLMFLFVVPGHALEIQKPEKGKGSYTVAAGETVNDTLVVFADTINIDGTITGDLIAMGRQVNVQGTVQGNVYCAGMIADISGNVDGDVIFFGQNFLANGRIGRNLWGGGSMFTLGRNIKLDNDVMLGASMVMINGNVGRDVMIGGGSLDVAGKVGRDLKFSGGQLMLHSPTAIGRDLKSTTQTEKQVRIDPGVTIAGKKSLEIEKPAVSRYATLGFYGKQALRIITAFITGMILLWVFPIVGRASLSTVRAILTSGGIGFLVAVATPVAAIILAITMIGLPIAIVSLALWLLGLYLSKIVIAKCIGNAILGSESNKLSVRALGLVIGLVIVIIAVNLPFIGGVLNFVLMLIGIGVLAKALYRAQVPALQQN